MFTCGGALCLLLAGCSDPEPRVYSVARETRAPVAPAASSEAQLPQNASLPPYRWEAPASWEPHALTTFRVGSYRPYGELHDLVDISVTTFPGSGGDDLANVNRWRDQLELPHLSPEQLQKDRQELPSQMGNLAFYDYTSDKILEVGGEKRRLAAAVYRDQVHNISWFFRISGAESAVEKEMNHFKSMVASFATGAGVQQMEIPVPAHHGHHAPVGGAMVAPFAGGQTAAAAPQVSTSTPAASAHSAHGAGDPIWNVPTGWEQYPAEGMRFANFRSTETDPVVAVTTNVFRFPGDAGGLLDNINRWRNELQLSPWTADEMMAGGTQMTVSGHSMFIVDLNAETGDPARRILGAVFKHGGESWFVKMEGAVSAVQANMQNFIDFLRSIRFPS